jgi:lipopolysaccharide heptosyltransferase II
VKNETVKKILVIRFSSLGDVLLTSALLKSIKENFPDAEVHYLTKQNFADVIRFNPNVDRVIEVDNNIDFSGLRKLRKEIKSNNYDLIIDAHNSLRSLYLRLFQNSKKLVFKKYSLRKFLLVNFKINLMKDLPPITVRYCNIIPENKFIYSHPEIYTDNKSKLNVEKLLSGLNLSADKKLVCIAPSSAHFTKTYPPEYYVELINEFEGKYIFLLIGKGKDKANIEIIKSQTGENVIDLCDKLNILELAELTNKCSLFISGDTGPMHIAEALNIPLIMLAGSSVREFGFYPQNKNSIALENNNLKCRPCSHIGKSKCPKGHFKCMKEIKPQSVYEAALRLLN